MGIDPVTHNPRLDLLDLSSILSSSLYNQSQMNISRLLGVNSLVNPELLRLATSFMSSQRENQNHKFIVDHNVEDNQLCSSHVQDQYQQPLMQSNRNHLPTQVQEIPACSIPFSNGTELMNMNQFPSNFSHLNDWQSNGMPSNLTKDYVPLPPNYDYYATDHHQHHNVMDPSSSETNNSNQSFSFASVLSTPSSSPTQLNSHSTYINNSGIEEEPDSYCSNILKFEIRDILDVNDFM